MHRARALTAGPVEKAASVRPGPYQVIALTGQGHLPSSSDTSVMTSNTSGHAQDGNFQVAPFLGDTAPADPT
eukprot:5874372-Karenia_brevis.AAC.1